MENERRRISAEDRTASQMQKVEDSPRFCYCMVSHNLITKESLVLKLFEKRLSRSIFLLIS